MSRTPERLTSGSDSLLVALGPPRPFRPWSPVSACRPTARGGAARRPAGAAGEEPTGSGVKPGSTGSGNASVVFSAIQGVGDATREITSARSGSRARNLSIPTWSKGATSDQSRPDSVLPASVLGQI